MIRFADYVVIVGYDFEKAVGLESQGCVLQRFPKKDWKSYPYEFHVESFCQPTGWRLTRNRQAPTFFVAYLTDIKGSQYYAACLTFYEAVATPMQQQQQQQQTNKPPSHAFSQRSHDRGYASSPSLSPLASSDENITGSGLMGGEIVDPHLVRPPDLFAPKCIVLLARHQHFDVLKNCLSIMYTVFMDSPQEFCLEQIIGNIVGSIEIPPVGGLRKTFSIGANDRQMVQPARCSTIPVTRSSVANLFNYLGIHNVLLMFSAVLSDQKLMLCSQSLVRLTEACHALTSIIYPLKYENTYVPILPKGLTEYLSAPTPFLYGIHASYYHVLPDISDVFIADLDVGSVTCPDNLHLPQIPQPFLTEIIQSLYQILSPDLLTADNIYPPSFHTTSKSSSLTPSRIDKRLRAIFLRLFASIFAGYRSCLTITRIHPQPVIHFNTSLFLVLRGIHEPDDFFDRILSSMRFHQFIMDRGPPYRVCDVFDEEYDSARSKTKYLMPQYISESMYPDMDYEVFVKDFNCALEKLAQKLLDNEVDEEHPINHLIQEEATKAHSRLHQSPFPILNPNLVDEFAEKSRASRSQSNVKSMDQQEPRFVPKGETLDRQAFKSELPRDKCRVIREFVADIFNRHITEALKRRNTIRQDLKSQPFRRLFVDELYKQIIPPSNSAPPPQQPTTMTLASIDEDENDEILEANRVIIEFEKRASLNWEQFDLIVGLLDEALRYEGMSYNTVIAPLVMDLTTRLSTNLGKMRYYANMTHHIQRHPIWEEMTFWENVFNDQVNNQICQLYLHHSGGVQRQGDGEDQTTSEKPPAYSPHLTALEIAAEELRVGCLRSSDVQASLQTQEEGTVYAQIVHFITLIINFRVPISAAASLTNSGQGTTSPVGVEPGFIGSTLERQPGGATQNGWLANNHASDRRDLHSTSTMPADRRQTNGHPSSTPFSNSSTMISGGGGMLLRDSVSYYDEFPLEDLMEWLRKFVDKVGAENFLTTKSITEINTKIDMILEGHLLNLADIYPEVKKIPKSKKPEIANPALLTGESIICLGGHDRLPCQLLIDGRMERGDWNQLDQVNPIQDSGSLSRELERYDDGDTVNRLLLPAQGALFITNYRVIFIGVPKDPYQSNKVVSRSFPVSALHSVKRIGTQRVTTTFSGSTIAFDHSSTTTATAKSSKGRGRPGILASTAEFLDVYRLRSLTMQMLRLGFDPDEVTSEAREEMRLVLQDLRFQAHLLLGFNVMLGPRLPQLQTAAADVQHKHPTGDTSVDTNSVSGGSSTGSFTPALRSRSQSQTNSLLASTILFNPSPQGKMTPGASSEAGARFSQLLSDTDSVSMAAEDSVRLTDGIGLKLALSISLANMRLAAIDPAIAQVFQQSLGYLDIVRVGLNASQGVPKRISSSSPLSSIQSSTSCHGNISRPALSPVISCSNSAYELTKSYPSLLIVPPQFSKSQLTRVARSYQQGRFPVIVWQHAETRALLLRGSALKAKSILAVIKHTASAVVSSTTTNAGAGSSATSNIGGSNQDRCSVDGDVSEMSSAKEHARYLHAIVDMSPSLLLSSAVSQSGSVGFGRTFDDSGLSVIAPSASSTTASPRISMVTDNPHQQLQRHMNTEKLGPLLQVSRASSRENTNNLAGSICSMKLQCETDEVISQNRNSLFFMDEDLAEMPYNSLLDISTKIDLKKKSRFHIHPIRKKHGVHGGALGKLTGVGRASHTTIDSQLSNENERGSTISNSSQHLFHPEIRAPVSLYVLCKRSAKPMNKSSHFPGVEFVPVDCASHTEIRDTFKKLYDACLPKDSRSRLTMFKGGVSNNAASGPGNYISMSGSPGGGASISTIVGEHEQTTEVDPTDIATAISESGWLGQVQSLLELAGVVVDIMAIQGCSVAVCLEDGWDVVTQVVSLAQIMLDSTYRTLAGFWSLIEKEWLLFGHCFNQRVGQKSTHRGGSVAPVFLQFLDAVHQLLTQFPLSFEFNDFFLQFLAYHHVSNRFHNFKYNSEFERLGHWFNLSVRPDQSTSGMVNEQQQLSSVSSVTSFEISSTKYQTHSIWQFIQAQHEEWPIFFNFYYSAEHVRKTIFPATNLAALNIWKYYISEDLATGPVFDLDLFCPSYRKHTNRPYEPVLRQGYNNSHVEQTYALLGLREGDDAVGWMNAWKETELAVKSEQVETEENATKLHRPAELPLSDEARADFDRCVLSQLSPQQLADTNIPVVPPRGPPLYMNTTLKADILHSPPSVPARLHGGNEIYSSNSLPKEKNHLPFYVDTNEDQKCLSASEFSPVTDTQPYTSGVDVVSLSSDDLASLGGGRIGGPTAANANLSIFDDDACSEAQQAVFAQHRAVTMRRMNRAVQKFTSPHQSSTLGVHGGSSIGDDISRSVIYQAGSLNTLPLIEDNFEYHSNATLFEQPHNFHRIKSTLSVSRCDWCQIILFVTGITRGVVRCSDCNFCCHEKCVPQVPRNCRRDAALLRSGPRRSGGVGTVFRSRRRGADNVDDYDRSIYFSHNSSPKPARSQATELIQGGLNQTLNGRLSSGASSIYGTSPRVPIYNTLPSQDSPSITVSSGKPCATTTNISSSPRPLPAYMRNVAFSSELYKLGHRRVLPNWKPRFFVLDTEHHQLRYYDTAEDEVPRGVIDLQDVRSVKLLRQPISGRFQENSTFEIETPNRQFRFGADDLITASKWVDKIQSTIL